MVVRKQHWAILFSLIALGTGTLWLLFGGESIEEGRCRLVRRKVPADSQLVSLASQFLLPRTAQPQSVRDLPAGFDQPCYYEIKSGGKRIPLVVNLSERPSLCVDTDGDGVLSQERCFTATPVRETNVNSSSLRFGPISLASQDRSSEAGGGFYVDCFRADAPAPLTTHPEFFRTGRLRLDGRTYRVAVVDGDCDGRFHSLLSLPLDQAWRIPESDVFAIDLNHNGQFEISLSGRCEVMPLGKLVQVASVYYTIDIAADGRSLVLSKTEPQFGTLVIEPNDTTVELGLWSDTSDQYLRGRQWQLPAGKYKAIYVASEKKDASGDAWSFSSTLSSAFTRLGSLELIVIRPGETTSIRVGPPFVVKADVQKMSSGRVSISPVIVGCAGEQYQAGFQRNYRRAPDCTFKIVDEEGTVLVASQFEYG